MKNYRIGISKALRWEINIKSKYDDPNPINYNVTLYAKSPKRARIKAKTIYTLNKTLKNRK